MKISEREIEEIKNKVNLEFPDDPALREIHIARKIISKEAELKGLSYFDYVKLLIKERTAKI